jgi:hypothetical protein
MSLQTWFFGRYIAVTSGLTRKRRYWGDFWTRKFELLFKTTGKMHATRAISNMTSRPSQRHKSVMAETIHSGLIPTVFTVKSSSEVQPQHTVVSSVFYDNLKPFLVVMRAMGVSPLRVTSTGNHFHCRSTNHKTAILWDMTPCGPTSVSLISVALTH